MTQSVAIIGGGFAGLAAGVYLTEKGFKVDLFEKRPILGGRAYSVKDSKTGDTLDNGQHLMMGCYHHTLAFLEKIGTKHLVEFQEKMEVNFVDPQGRNYVLKCPNLPAPLHLLWGLICLKSLDASEKWAMMKFMAGVKKLNENELSSLDLISCEQWLTLWNQSNESIQNFWEPLILATLNETPQISSAQMLAVVIREALLKTKQDSRMIWSKVGLSELYTEAAQKFIENQGGKVHLRRGVQKIITSPSLRPSPSRGEGEYVVKIILEDGSEHIANYYINTSPAEAFMPLLEENIARQNFFERFSEITYSPILGINLWFDRPVTNKTFVGILNSPVHWVFNKEKILHMEVQQTTDLQNNYLSLVLSGAHNLKDMPAEALLRMCLDEIQKAFPESKNAKLLHHRIMKELKATPSFGIGSSKLRPTYETPISNLFLAGDWTATGLPATIEGAVKSGHELAELIFQKV